MSFFDIDAAVRNVKLSQTANPANLAKNSNFCNEVNNLQDSPNCETLENHCENPANQQNTVETEIHGLAEDSQRFAKDSQLQVNDSKKDLQDSQDSQSDRSQDFQKPRLEDLQPDRPVGHTEDGRPIYRCPRGELITVPRAKT